MLINKLCFNLLLMLSLQHVKIAGYFYGIYKKQTIIQQKNIQVVFTVKMAQEMNLNFILYLNLYFNRQQF